MHFKKTFLILLVVVLSFPLSNSIGVLFGQQQQEQTTTTAVTPEKKIEDTYTVGPRDIIRIRVFGAPELTTRARVSGSGDITMPLLGEVQVQGLTTSQLETRLARMLEKNFMKNAQVTVFIEEYQSNKVAVIGAVTTPGNYEVIGRETLLQLISKAGGLNERASDRVVVIRKKKSTVIDLEELMMKGTPELNIALQPGDIVNVPHMRYIDIYVFGQVQHPGILRIRRSGKITLLKAIAQAGGFGIRARKGSVIIKRRIDGKEMQIKVNVKKIISGKRSAFILENDDIVFVPERLL